MKKLTGFLSILNIFFGNVSAQTQPKDLGSFIQENINNAYKKDKLPGIFVGILDEGERRYFTAGFARPDSKTIFDSTTVFEIGSITKTFTAYVLMQVLQENKISENALVLNYLPEEVQQNKKLAHISFLSLMNHTSGLPRLPNNITLLNKAPYDDYTAEKLFAFLSTCNPKPDGNSNYSNLGAGLAGVLAQRISGKTFNQLIEKYITIPFKMGNAPVNNAANTSQGYFSASEKTAYWNMDVLAPAGGLQYNTSQVLTYLQNMSMPPATGNAKQVVDKLTTNSIALTPQLGVGLGWHIFDYNTLQPIYWHNGGTFGFSTFCAFAKDKSKAVVVVINQFNKNGIGDRLGITIIKRMLGEE